jgi:LysM repeat protein
MRKISIWLLFLVFTAASLARAQDATQQQIDKLSGQIQDLLDAQAQQGKRMDALEKEISDLGDKLNQPAANNFASADDLKKLAGQVQDVAKKQQEDNDLVLKEIAKLGKVSGISTTSHKPPANVATTPTDNSTQTSAGPQKGHNYTVKSGDTVSAIAKLYHAQGVKVTRDEILKANPGLDPGKLYIGQKIFIPDPAAQ